MNVSYFDPRTDKPVGPAECSAAQVPALLDIIQSLDEGRGHPTLEFTRDDGSSLGLSTDGERAFLVWVNSIGESFHSVGGGVKSGDKVMVYDYFGSWSEAPPDWLVPLEDARQCAEKFFRTGTADTEKVLFEPD